MIGHVRFERGQDVILFIAGSGNAWLRKMMRAASALRLERSAP
jgi:hypothetical protein